MKLCVSFSGGKTSAYMARWCQQHAHEHGFDEVRYVFANTGQEHEKTLEFVQRCDDEWGLGVTWVEAVVHHGERKGCTHKVVDFDTASRDGEPFEQVIKKYGIPNQALRFTCTRELKLNPQRSYRKSIGWDDCYQAIGIRSDEIDRMQPDAREKRVVYPLISMRQMDRASVDRFWSRQKFTLEIPPLMGNCVTCWKKTDRKLLTIAKAEPQRFDWNRRMEAKYGKCGGTDEAQSFQSVFFRKSRSTDDIIALSREPFRPWVETQQDDLFSEMDTPNGCSDSCEVTW